jgi:hypothetical protein
VRSEDLDELTFLENAHTKADAAYKVAAADLTRDATPAGERLLAATDALLAFWRRIRQQTEDEIEGIR